MPDQNQKIKFESCQGILPGHMKANKMLVQTIGRLSLIDILLNTLIDDMRNSYISNTIKQII